MRITVVVDDMAGRRGTLGEHGLAYWLEVDGQHILFDTGAGLALAHNASALGIPLDQTDAVMLSHGHYDHTGGLPTALQAAPHARLYLHPDALGTKFALNSDGSSRSIGIPDAAREAVQAHTGGQVLVDEPTEITSDLWATGPVPRVTSFERPGGPFFVDEACRHTDPLMDDLALFSRTPQGLVVVLGCAHAGVINTLQHVMNVSGESRIHAVVGGMHLLAASPEHIAATAHTLGELDVRQLAIAHCTGLDATLALYGHWGETCRVLRVGDVLEFRRECPL